MSKFIVTLCFLVFTLFLTVPSYAMPTCNFDNTAISFKARNESIMNIIKSIEKQLGIVISIQNPGTLESTKSSISFYDTPLDLAFKRLLKNTNYVITCDEDTNVLLLTVTGNRPAGPDSLGSKTNGSQVADVESPFSPNQRNIERIVPRPQEDLGDNNSEYVVASPFPPERRDLSASQPRPDYDEGSSTYDTESPFPPSERSLAAIPVRQHSDDSNQSSGSMVDLPFAPEQRDLLSVEPRSNTDLSEEYSEDSPFAPDIRTN